VRTTIKGEASNSRDAQQGRQYQEDATAGTPVTGGRHSRDASNRRTPQQKGIQQSIGKPSAEIQIQTNNTNNLFPPHGTIVLCFNIKVNKKLHTCFREK
jgi:hypothetical protein